jgi:hypothetical protein
MSHYLFPSTISISVVFVTLISIAMSSRSTVPLFEGLRATVSASAVGGRTQQQGMVAGVESSSNGVR